MNLCSTLASDVVSAAKSPSRVLGGTARIVLQKYLWISVILVRIACTKQVSTRKITNENLFIHQRHSWKWLCVQGTSYNYYDPNYFPANRWHGREHHLLVLFKHNNGIIVQYVRSLKRFSALPEMTPTVGELPECSPQVKLCTVVALDHCPAAGHSWSARGFWWASPTTLKAF